MYWMDFYNEIFVVGFYVLDKFQSLFLGLFFGYHAEGYHAPPLSFPATTPKANTPVQMHSS